jgi:hypothetical protein
VIHFSIRVCDDFKVTLYGADTFVRQSIRFAYNCFMAVPVTRRKITVNTADRNANFSNQIMTAVAHYVNTLKPNFLWFIPFCFVILLRLKPSLSFLKIHVWMWISLWRLVAEYLSLTFLFVVELSIINLIYLWLYSPFVGPWPLFQFLNSKQSVGLPWAGDKPVTRSLLTHRTTQTQSKRTQKPMPRVGFEPTILAFERLKTGHALDRAATVTG